MEKNGFLEVIGRRRSCYSLGGGACAPDRKVEETLRFLIRNVPSSFNSQSQRMAVLFGESQQKLWSIVMETLRRIVPPEKFARTEKKIDGFAAARGTVLYFDDGSVTGEMAKKFPLYAANFPVWAEQANGMLQFAVWCALEELGFGASLQHYNPLIDDEVKRTFNIPSDWRLIAQMPFGALTAPPGPKTFVDAERVLSFGAEI
ncbi:MAG: nitroreductase family protein [Victivallaceae bacterium]|nr:nitroreductase family protein [Victivallaceae bacterium]